MRKITTRRDREKGNRTKQIMVGGVLIIIMFLSVLGYAFRREDPGQSKKVQYNGYDFINQNGLWYTTLGNFNFAFKYNPLQVERIDSEVSVLSSYSGTPLYISSESEEALYEVYRNLDPRSNSVVQRIQTACFDLEDCVADVPIKTCEDNFIIIRENETVSLTQDQKCVFIEGPSQNLTHITDEFLFKIIGIE